MDGHDGHVTLARCLAAPNEKIGLFEIPASASGDGDGDGARAGGGGGGGGGKCRVRSDSPRDTTAHASRFANARLRRWKS